MRKILLLILFPAVLIFSQDDKTKNPNVELPDFVITGQDVISIKRAVKIKPDFIPIVTEKFVKPVHSPEELGLRQLSDPVKEDLTLIDSTTFSNGSLSAGAGIYILPEAKFNYTYPFKNGILKTDLGGMYQRDYIDNSDRYSFFGGAAIEYSFGVVDKSLPGTRFLLGGDYNSLAYKLFASNNPGQKRTKNEGNYYLGIKSTAGKVFIFDLQFDNYVTSLVENNFSENLINLNGFARLQLSDVGLGIKTNYQKQFFTTDSLNNAGFNYFFFRPTVSFELFNSVKTEVGYTFTNSGGENFNKIYVAFGLRISQNMVLLGEFSPTAEFVTSGSYLRINDYFNPVKFNNLFYRKSNYFDVAVKYEYERYYQVDAGLRYFKSGNLPFFIASNNSGQFDIATADAENYNTYLNLSFHFGPYGVLYGSFDYFRVRDNSGNKIPYQPKLKGNITYGYEFKKGLLGEVLVDYYSDRFTDLQNTIKLNSFFDLGIKLTYKLQETFILKLEMYNLLNRDIFLWQGYKEKPFDLMLGFNMLFD
ncbi:MAG: hypothetical protein BMS9Abin39_0625 [Ignavibacteria bacterium]|nr:MAG: hypothetical protein BMS9Abin39_0625 [Ignavibacteria bacterium]